MIPISNPIEHFLQKQRFALVHHSLRGSVLDFGGNDGELRKFVTGSYTCVNYDHSLMIGKRFDTIVALAIIEHLSVEDVYNVFAEFKKSLNAGGKIYLTTPTKIAKPVLELLACLSLVDRANILEHKHYWTKNELLNLARTSGFVVTRYKKFQFGFNQFAVFV